MINGLQFRHFLFSAFVAFFFFACSSGGGSNPNGPNGPNDPDNPNNPDNPNKNGKGAYGALPSNQNPNRVQEMYNDWINFYYITFEEEANQGVFNPNNVSEEVKGSARIKAQYSGCTGGDCTVSEAIGYGMILTALMNDRERFDKLLKYSKAFRISGMALMRWEIVNFMSGAGGSATDADIDIAAALMIMHGKTGEQSYLNDALEIGNSIYEWEVNENTKLILPAIKNEAWVKDGNLYNISYFSLPAIKMLAEHDNKWNEVLEKTIAYMEKSQNGGDGLWPDWSDANGAPVAKDPNKSNTTLAATSGATMNSFESYYKEAPRIPWRIAWYYHWYGDERAKAMLDKGIAFLRSKGVEEAKQAKEMYGYNNSLESSSAATDARWSSYCALGMGSSVNQDWLNSCNDRLIGDYSPSISQYYPRSLRLIYAMLFNGKF